MATLSVIKFNTSGSAGETVALIRRLSEEQMIRMEEAAIVTWRKSQATPQTRLLADMAGLSAADGGAFWGMLFGLLFFVPDYDRSNSPTARRFADYGVDEQFIRAIREKVIAGTSAIFLARNHGVLERIIAAVREKGLTFELITPRFANCQDLRS